MNKYWKYVLYPRFLDSIRDCTYTNMEDADLTEVLNNITKTAIEQFPFCKVDLDYEEDTSYDALDGESYGYYFTDDNIGEAEYNVLLALMKVEWISAQITWDANFRNPFYDKDIKGFSPANMLTAMRGQLQLFQTNATKAKFDYNRINKDGKIAWGQVNRVK